VSDTPTSDLVVNSDAIAKIVDGRIEDRLKVYQSYVKGFLAALALLAAVGLTARNVLITPIMRWAYPPEAITADLDKLSSIGTSDIDKLGSALFEKFGDRVDSGYSKTMVFEPNIVPVDNYIVFYARKDQSCFATIEPDNGDAPFHFVITVDQKSWQLDRAVDDSSVTEYLSFGMGGATPGSNLHILKVVPTQRVQSQTVVRSVVLVKNKKD
jgi:hypothetical protein